MVKEGHCRMNYNLQAAVQHQRALVVCKLVSAALPCIGKDVTHAHGPVAYI